MKMHGAMISTRGLCYTNATCFYQITIKEPNLIPIYFSIFPICVYFKAFWLVKIVWRLVMIDSKACTCEWWPRCTVQTPKGSSHYKNPLSWTGQLLYQWKGGVCPNYPRYWSLTNNVSWFTEGLNSPSGDVAMEDKARGFHTLKRRFKEKKKKKDTPLYLFRGRCKLLESTMSFPLWERHYHARKNRTVAWRYRRSRALWFRRRRTGRETGIISSIKCVTWEKIE